MEAKYTLGIDVGSTTSKCVIVKDGQEIVSKSLVSVGAGTSGPERAIKEVLDNCGMKKEDMSFILGTGYGRNSLDIVDDQMSELSCHAKGAYYLFPEVHTVIDIGGQDMKVLQIDNGVMVNFQMNDKCAAGTGRFLDVMARVLEVNVAESEVISQLAQGSEVCDIINGIHHSIAARMSGLARRVGVRDQVVMTGGVAQNAGVVAALEEELGHKVYTSPLAQYAGALGAALFAYQKATRKK